MRQGSLIDATSIKAQTHTTPQGEANADRDADWTCRGKDGHFGHKVHLTVDQGSDLLRHLALIAASV